MTEQTELNIDEKSRLNNSLKSLEQVIEKYTKHMEGKARGEAASESQVEIDRLNDKLKDLNQVLAAKNEELSLLSSDVVKLRAENRKLQEVNKQVADLLGNSIKEIEELVA